MNKAMSSSKNSTAPKSTVNANYMQVIRDSQKVQNEREKLAVQKSKILGLSFDKIKHRDMEKLNDFILANQGSKQ